MIVVTGAAGHLGRRTVELLLERVDAAEVVAATRRPEQLDDLAGKGVTVRAADFDDPAGLARAFDGADRLLLVSTDDLRPGSGSRSTGRGRGRRAAGRERARRRGAGDHRAGVGVLRGGRRGAERGHRAPGAGAGARERLGVP